MIIRKIKAIVAGLLLMILPVGYIDVDTYISSIGYRAIQDAVSISGYNYKDTPKVVFVPYKIISDWYCESKKCGIAGLYIDGANYVVLVSEKVDLDTPLGYSILVHEMVHYLQVQEIHSIDPLYKPSCRERKDMEMEAYQTQVKYLMNQEAIDEAKMVYRSGMFVAMFMCNGVE